MDASIVGSRIRQHRRDLGISQTDLARQIGISPSYLNLIEWNKRSITPALLESVAGALGVDPRDLDSASDRRLHETLLEYAHQPSLEGLGIETARTDELIGRFPGWARGIAALARSEQDAVVRARTLSDRLSNDPFLGEEIHRMLSRIAAIRSAAEILTDYPDIEADRRERFNRIVFEESRVLSEVGEALAAYLDKAEEADRVLTPLDEVEALFEARENRFDEIEASAERLAANLTDPQPVSRQAEARDLVAHHLDGNIAELIDRQPQIGTAAARERAQRALSEYAVHAILMPRTRFADEAAACGYDIEALSEAFSSPIAAVCHRLTALPRAEGVPRFGYYRANAAGSIVEMRGIDGLAIPRYAAACPLWVLYRAQQSPEAMIRQRALFPSGIRFVFVARARNTGTTGFGKPRHYVTDMVAMSESDAAATVYAPDPSSLVEEVGPSCRLCPRRTCTHRVEDPFAL